MLSKFKRLMVLFVMIHCVISAKPANDPQSTFRSSDSISSKIDSMVGTWSEDNTPGGVVGVIKDGEWLFHRAYGLMNMDYALPNTETTVFNIGSMAKQFTAFSILMLNEEGKLSLDDDIRESLPEFPDYGHTITIRHLLHHTSGIHSFDVLELVAGNLGYGMDKKAMFELISRQKQLNYNPGEEFLYSNSGYFLLGEIVERISGKSLGQYADEKIFNPLGMENTFVFEKKNRIVSNRAMGYTRDKDGTFRVGYSHFDDVITGSSNVYSTLEDLLLWERNFYTKSLGGAEIIDMMLNLNDTLNNGEMIPYTYGLNVTKHNGLKAVDHGGTTSGFNCLMITFPEYQFSVICIFNLQDTNPWRFVREVADLYLSGYYEPVKKEEKPKDRKVAAIDPAVYQDYVGEYEMDNGLILKIAENENSLELVLPDNAKFTLFPESETDFFLRAFDAQCSFNRDASGQVNELVWHQGGEHPIGKRKTGKQDEKPTAEQLACFSGDYYSDEVLVTYSVYLEDDQLRMRLPQTFLETMGFEGVPALAHVDGDTFLLNVRGIMIEFTRAENDRINGFIIKDLGRVRNLLFNRK